MRTSAFEEAPQEQGGPMVIYVLKMDGRKVTISDVTPQTTMGEVKFQVADYTGIEKTKFRLAYMGKTRNEDDTLQKCSIPSGATLHMLWRQTGGK
uniref:Ubiquitin-like domain-containing protein n=1 Tax=Panagrolaimus davidi TaxID=227884 RepID=A0A914PC70_9BILA